MHDNLKVYHLYLEFAGNSAAVVENAESWHSFTGHLNRATESIGTNMIRGNSQSNMAARRADFDVALGSTAECAACLDVASIKKVISVNDLADTRMQLWRIRGMMLGLREAEPNQVMEESGLYGTPIFPHEKLELYQVSLEAVRWMSTFFLKHILPSRQRNRLDETTTGILLNLAEGTAKPTAKDKVKFFDIAYDHALQSALVMDLLVARKMLVSEDVRDGRKLLDRIAEMLHSWTNKLKGIKPNSVSTVPG